MKKLSESLIDDVISRSRNKNEREEDKIHWIDFGDFYLADRLYEKDGNIYFTYEETMKMFPEGGEIGLLDEETCEKLECMIDISKKGVDIWRFNHDEYIINLPLSGANDIPQSKTQTITWIYGKSENHPDENVRCCIFRMGVTVHDIDKKAKVVILLMKKKKMNESLIDDVISRSRNDSKRKEDEIHWVDMGQFYLADRVYEEKGNVNFSYFDAMRMFPEDGEIRLLDENYTLALKCNTNNKDSILITCPRSGNSVEIPWVGMNGDKPNFYEMDTWMYGDRSSLWGDDKAYVCIFRQNRVMKGAFDIYKYTLPILLMKKKKMNESLIDDVISRSRGGEKRDEDKSPFDKGFEIIKNTEFIKIGDQYWCPFNFGSDSMDKPGDYLSPKQIRNLYEYLEDTEYRVVEYDDWWGAYSFMKKPRMEKDNDGHTFFSNVINGVDFNIYNFGYIPQNKDEVVYDNIVRFGDLNDDLVGFTKVSYQRYFFLRHATDDETSAKYQVRLMKR